MKLLSRLIFSSGLCILIVAGSFAQSDSLRTVNPEALPPLIDESDQPLDSISDVQLSKREKDTINYPLVSAISVSFDYPKLFSFFTEFENKAEIGVYFQILKHFRVITEFGRGRIQPTNFYKNANYEVSGNYFRAGLGYTKTLGAASRLYFGVNYGSSFFDDKGNIQIESPSGLSNPLEEPFRRKGLRGDWFELTFGTESHIGNNLYLGFTARLRKLNSYDSFEELDVFSVPGYGRTFDNSIPALNLYLKYRIQFY